MQNLLFNKKAKQKGKKLKLYQTKESYTKLNVVDLKLQFILVQEIKIIKDVLTLDSLELQTILHFIAVDTSYNFG